MVLLVACECLNVKLRLVDSSLSYTTTTDGTTASTPLPADRVVGDMLRKPIAAAVVAERPEPIFAPATGEDAASDLTTSLSGSAPSSLASSTVITASTAATAATAAGAPALVVGGGQQPHPAEQDPFLASWFGTSSAATSHSTTTATTTTTNAATVDAPGASAGGLCVGTLGLGGAVVELAGLTRYRKVFECYPATPSHSNNATAANAQSTTTATVVAGDLHREAVWTVTRCVNCEMDVFASFRPLGVSCSRPNAPTLAALLPKTAILTSSKLIVGQEAVARRQTQENYSPIFRVILDPLSPSELADAAAVLEKSNDLLQALQEQVTSQLKREKDASEARIKAYIDKEHADYTKLEKSAHDVKFTLFHKLAGLRQQAIATAISDAMGDALNDVLGNDSPVFSPLSASKSPKSGLAQVASQLQHLAAMEAVPAVVVTTEQGPQRFSPAGYNGHRGSPSSVLGASARENSDIPTLSTVGVRIPPASFTASPRFPVVPPSSVAGSFIPPSSVSNASRFSSALSEGLKSVASDSDAPPTTSTDSPKLLNRIVWNKGASSNSGSQHSNLSKSVPASRVNFGGRRDSDSSDALFDMDGFESSSSTDRHRRNDTFDEEDEEDALEEGASTGRQLAAPAADGMALYASSVPMGIPARAAASFVADDDSMAYRSRGLQVPGSPETDRMQDLAASIRELSRLSVNDSTATFGDLPRRKMSTIL